MAGQLARWGAIALLSALCSAPSAQGVATASADGLKPGDQVTGALSYGRRTFALPPGTWRLINKRERDANRGGASGNLMLEAAFDQVVEGRLSKTLELVASKYSNRFSWLDEPCKATGDSYWIEDRGRSDNDQLCIRVGFRSDMVVGARGEVFLAWARDLNSKNIRFSREMPYVRVTRFTSYDFLAMTISFDAEAAGLTPSRNPTRNLNDWLPANLEQQADRRAYYEALKAWAPTFASAVAKAFDGDTSLTSAAYGEPSIVRKP